MKSGYKWLIAVLVVSGLLVVSLVKGSFALSRSAWWSRQGEVRHAARGPWGTLWYVRSLIEIPPERVQVGPWAYTPTRWYLEGESDDDVMAVLRGCGLDDRQAQDLLAAEIAVTNGVGHILQPSESFILSLDPETRAHLYERLGRYPQNEAQFSPFRFSGEETQDWLDGANVSSEVKALVESLIYRHGKARLFSDLTLVLNRYPSAQTHSNLFMSLSREATLLARVRVLPKDNVDELAEYWGVPDRQAEVRTMLRTLQVSGVCRDVPVTLLLPTFAKSRLYRYSRAGDPAFPSCHYTAMNFFNEEPDNRFLDLGEAAKVLARDYVVVTNDFRLGDIILLMRNSREAIHSCNYIADRIVFTRNGGNWAQPWMLTTLDALIDFYSYPDPVTVKVVRRRDLMAKGPDPKFQVR